MNRLYKLFILGELMDHPMHGYKLYSVLNIVIGPLRKISWGVLYPLIHELQNDTFIEPADGSEQQKGSGKNKRSYRITEEGRRQFYKLMEDPIPYKPEYELHFRVKMANFDQIDPQLRLVILHQFKDYLEFFRRHIEESKKSISKGQIPDGEKQYLLSINEHRMERLSMDEKWLSSCIQSATLGERIIQNDSKCSNK